MSELQTSETRMRRGGIRSKKLSTRVDLTPMVDLGFLLITFFVFTATTSQAKAMNLIMPDDRNVDNPNAAPESKTISVILGADNKVFVYEGLSIDKIKQSDYSANGLRNIIQQKKVELKNRFGKDNELIVLIKPTASASYKNTIDALDEMLISDVKKYVLMEVRKEESERIKK